MSTIFQVCVVIVTLALVFVAYVAWRIHNRFEKLAHKISLGIDEVRRTTTEAQQVIFTLQDIAHGLQRSSMQFESIGHRAAGLASLVLDEVEKPTRGAVAFAHSLKAGAKALFRRPGRYYSTHQLNGGDHV